MRESYGDSTGENVFIKSQTPRRPVPDPVQEHSTDNLRQRVARGGALTLAVRLGVQIVTWLVTFLVLRLLSPADYGLMVTATLFAGLADVLAEAGLLWALVQRKRITQEEMAESFTLSLFLSVGLYLVLWGLSAPVAKYLGAPDLTSLIRFIGLVVFMVPVRTIGAASLRRQLRLGTIAIIHGVAALAQSGTLLLLAFQGYGVWSLAWGFVCAHTLQTLLFWYVSGCRLTIRKPSTGSFELLRYGLTISASTLAWFLFESADVAVISAVLGQTTLGYYAIALLVVKAPLEKMSVYINQIAFTTYCKLQDDLHRLHNWFVRLLALQLLIVCPALLGLALIADDAVPLILGEKWQYSVLPIQLLAPTGVFLIISTSFAPLFNAIGRADITFKYDLTCLASFTVAFLIASHFFGLVGICLVWLTLYPLLITLMVQITSSVTSITITDMMRATAPIFLGTIFMAVVVAGVRFFLPDALHPALRIAALIAGGVLSYSAWVLTFASKTMLTDIYILAAELGWRRSAAPEAACRKPADPDS